MPEPDHGTHGTDADCAISVEPILSPSARIAADGGPIHTMGRAGGDGAAAAASASEAASVSSEDAAAEDEEPAVVLEAAAAAAASASAERAASASGSFGFSDAWPQPAHTASAPVRCATSTISLTFA